jgi:hypothetical protein
MSKGAKGAPSKGLEMARRDGGEEEEGLTPNLDLEGGASQTRSMAHIYLTFDFGTDEEKAQQARHKLDGWKQAFRLDKKLIYKFDRSDGAAGGKGGEPPKEAARAAKSAKEEKNAKTEKGKSAKAPKSGEAGTEPKEVPETPEKIKLLIRLAFSNHERLSEQRWVERIPAEEPFKEASPATLRNGVATFEEMEARFEDLD